MTRPNDEENGEEGAIIALFRLLRGWTQTRLADKAGMHKSRISRYEAGEDVPKPPSRERIRKAAGVPDVLVAPIRSFLRLLRSALASMEAGKRPAGEAGPPEEVQQAVWGIVERSISLARLELGLLPRRAASPASQPTPPTADDRARVETLLQVLRSYKDKDRRLLVEGSASFQDWLLCVRLCDESERVAPHSAKEAQEWAELAQLVARRVPEADGWRSYLEGWAEPFLGNALRVGGELRPAEAAFDRGSRLRKAGSDEAGLLDESRLLDLEASLRRAQGRFPEALRLHDRALEIAPPDQKAAILLSKSATLEEKGDYEGSIKVLEQAARSIDGQRQPRLLCILRFNEAANLCRLGRANEAEPIVAEVRDLAERLRNDLDLVRTLWLEGLVHTGLGRLEQAVAALEQVRRDFAARLIPYDFALASLDLALLYREQGRSAEVLELAEEMLRIFEAADVHREALAAVLLFRDSARKGKVTAGLVSRLQEFLKKARTNPKLRFEI